MEEMRKGSESMKNRLFIYRNGLFPVDNPK